MKLNLYNTLSREKQEFQPRGERVEMFVCGPTVYDSTHIGHAKTYIQMDILARLIRFLGYDLFYLQNITDIDDKILSRAKESNTGWRELSDKYLAEYLEDMQAINATSVNEYAKATDYINDIVRQISTLIDMGKAYKVDDGIYFEISSFQEYGKLSGRSQIAEDDAQSRIDQSDQKRGWNDFCLWKFARDNEPSWPAPFGDGRPGWHIEDTAISEHFFGPQYDIHGGALDLVFPHHEAELTLMESISGKEPFVKNWVHTGFLTVGGKKMSKSLGNTFTIRELLDRGYKGEEIRMAVLQSHYRSPMDFSIENLDSAKSRLQRWRSVAALRHQVNGQDDLPLKETIDAVINNLCDDLNTPEVLSILEHQFMLILNDPLALEPQSFSDFLRVIDDLTGLRLLESTPNITQEIKDLIEKRQQLRQDNSWEESDKIRDELTNKGVVLQDIGETTLWQYI